MKTLLTFCIVYSALRLSHAEEPRGPNRYWPGDFERGFAGGCFSTIRGGVISETENHTPGGGKSWQLSPGYQHLELLVPAHARGKLGFRAKSPHAQTVTLKVVAPDPAEGKTPRTIDYSVEIKASAEWELYEVEFETLAAYPRPPTTEILLSAWNGTQSPAFIDDLSLRMLPGEAEPAGRVPKPAPLAEPAGGEARVWLFNPGAVGAFPKSLLWEALNSEGIRGKRVRVRASVTYATMNAPFEPWSGALLVLHAGAGPDAEVLQPLGGHPFWCPMGHAAPPGEAKIISAEYELPADLKALTLAVQVQPGVGANAVRVENVTFEILDTSTGSK